MKTILHISRMNFLSNKAHVYTTAKTCEALAMQEGVKVVLLSSDDSLASDEAKREFYEKHDIVRKFEIVSLASVANRLKGSRFRLFNWLETIAVNLSILKYVLLNGKKFDVLYYRDCSLFLPVLVAKYIQGKPIFLELHAVLHKRHGQWLNEYFSKISDGLIPITRGLEDYYRKFNPKSVVAFCAAAEPEKFDRISESGEQLRRKLGLPLDKLILMYSGNLHKTGNNDSYGIEDIVRALTRLDQSVIFIGIGKKGQETKGHENLARELGVAERVKFLPWMRRREVYEYWKAADILVHPAAGSQIGNSPTKIFEYLAAGKPIVSADTTAIREILRDGKNAVLVRDSGDPEAWATAIGKVRENTTFRNNIVAGAQSDCKSYTWSGRGSLIWDFIRQTSFANCR